MEKQYTYEDGLNVLNYLGITNLTKKEKQIFRDKWSNFYNGNNLITAIWRLYAEALPFICGDGDKGSFIAAQLKDSDFGKRLKTTGLDEKLKQNIDLDKILEEGSHIFMIKLKQ